MIIKLFLLSIAIVGIVFVLMSISILIKKNGKFPNMHIGSNKEMQKRGISCATSQHKMAQKSTIKIKPLYLGGEDESTSLSC